MRPVPLDGAPTALALPAGLQLHSIKRLIDEYRQSPERREGIATVSDLASFIALTTRFKDDDSALFCDRTPAKPQFLAVLDYHRAGGDGAARFARHRVQYDFPLSETWRAWSDVDAERMDQGEFAAFLEDRIGDVLPPPLSEDLTDERFPGLDELARAIGGQWAAPAQLLDLARGLTVRVGQRLKDIRNLSSGEVQIQYEAEHHDDAGQPLRIPQLFLIGVPIFDGGPLYRLAVRLRYRVAGNSVGWFLIRHRPDLALRHALDEAAATAARETELPLYFGTPEA